jgi:hypothetical protein
MLLRILAGISLTAALLFAGCTTEKGMANLDNPAVPSQTGKSVYLMTVTLRNTFVTSYQPRLFSVKLAKKTSSENQHFITFEPDPQSRSESNSVATGCSYLLRMELEPGTYTLVGLNCLGQSLMMNADFFVPIAARLKTPAAGAFYLGHIEATVRERKGDEFRACGARLPTQEQRLTGAWGGTFDVVITDEWTADAAKFGAKFPAIATMNVQKDLLPAFERGRIQAWWEKNAFNDVP